MDKNNNSDYYYYDKEKIEEELKKGFFSLKFSKEVEQKFKEFLFIRIRESMRFSILLEFLYILSLAFWITLFIRISLENYFLSVMF